MHKLRRPDPPICLTDTSVRSYGELHGNEKAEIRHKLLDMQRHRCAYCERRTGENAQDGHIEHFKKQAHHKNLSLTWSNLFWSCNDENTCGKHKDKCVRTGGEHGSFSEDELINPEVDEPEEIFLFVVDGTVRPKDGLDGVSKRKADETLRVFQLDRSAYLNRARADAVRPYIRAVDSLLIAGPEIVTRYIQNELQQSESAPFGTAIKQYLEGISP